MNKEEVLIAIKEIQCRYSLPALEQNYTDKDYACRQYEKLVIHLSNQKEKQQQELERYKNIIDELETYLQRKYCEYIDMESDDAFVISLVLDTLRELKGE